MPGVLKTVAIDGMGDGAFCVGENDPNLSNEAITLLANAEVYPAGTILGKITASGKYKKWDIAAVDGSEVVKAILWGRKEISAADQKAVAVFRHQVVNGYALTYLAAATDPQKAAAEAVLATAMIMVRR